MKSNKIMKKKYIAILLFILLIFSLFKSRKYYVLENKTLNKKTYFTFDDFKKLEKTDSIIAFGFGNVMFLKRNILNICVFSFNDYKNLKVNCIDVIYDKRKKTFNYNQVYDMNIDNPNRTQFLTYEVEGEIIQGYEKMVYPDVFGKDTCWINFYDMFKWRHRKIGDEFDVKLIVHYEVDARPYIQELNYKAKCCESYPKRLIDSFCLF